MNDVVHRDLSRHPNFQDRTGTIINGITLLEFLGWDKHELAIYRCKCHCGNQFTTRYRDLQQGNTTSCGCLHARGLRKDDEYRKMIGQKHNRLTILDYERIERNGKSRGYFHCRCDCGNEVTVRTDGLLGGTSRSCGCLQKETVSEFAKNYDVSKRKPSTRVYTRKQTVDNPEILSHIGEKHNLLTIIDCIRKETGNRLRNFYTCRCDCGNIIDVRTDAVLRGTSKSCGCLQKDAARELDRSNAPSHNLSDTRLHNIWAGMKGRCYNPKSPSYNRYGGRGIRICDEWILFDHEKNENTGFLNFYEWAIENGYSDDLSIDRIDVNGNYCPENCRWASVYEQSWNKRNNVYITYEQRFDEIGKDPVRYTFPLSLWARITGIRASVIKRRIFKFRPYWSVNDALTTPVGASIDDERGTMILDVGAYMEYNQPDKYDISIRD